MPEKRLLSTCVLLLLSLLLLDYPGSAQRNIGYVHGELTSDTIGGSLGDFLIEMIQPGNQGTRERARVSGDGSFTFRNLDAGSYMLRVLDLHGESVYEEPITVHEGLEIAIRLQAPKGSKAPSGTVSAHDLAHPLPRNALKEYTAAKKAAAGGDQDKAIAHYQKAVAMYPDFAEAWNDLAVAFIRKDRVADAADCLQKAAAIQPRMSMIQSNLSLVQAKLGRLDEAENSARLALELDSESPRAQQALALSLALRKRESSMLPH
jgi:tetratricopeptide (TPR) repeat protein